jgi:hypothetical protein
VASCRGTPTVSDLVATHGSGLRRYVLVEGPNAQLVRPGRAWYTVSEVDRDAILLLTRHAPPPLTDEPSSGIGKTSGI